MARSDALIEEHLIRGPSRRWAGRAEPPGMGASWGHPSDYLAAPSGVRGAVLAGTCGEQLQGRRTATPGDAGSVPQQLPPLCRLPSSPRLCEDPWLDPTGHLRQRSPLVSLLGHRGGGAGRGGPGGLRTAHALPGPPAPGWLAEPSHCGDEPQRI